MSQYEKISSYLDRHGSITPMEAFSALHITKLATRIGEMNRMGFNIVGQMESHKNQQGETSRYMRYRKEV